MQSDIAIIGLSSTILSMDQYQMTAFNDASELIKDIVQRNAEGAPLPKLILCSSNENILEIDKMTRFLTKEKHESPLLIVDKVINKIRVSMFRGVGAYEILDGNLSPSELSDKVSQVFRAYFVEQKAKNAPKKYQISLWKRAFDILVSSLLITLLSPLFLLVGLLIRLESRGSVFYYQSRVGTGYKIFHFYKFRSMRIGADAEVAKLKSQNQYAKKKTEESKSEDNIGLLGNEGWIGESAHKQKLAESEENAFFKVKNDPRITKVGKFIRNTSIDELPQLFNVLLGDMSIVGNRPLPLYEAEKLTSDKWAKRFMAPAGITGLWQVTERGKANTSNDSRKQLDVTYAQGHTFLGDLYILFKTPLAAIQKENV